MIEVTNEKVAVAKEKLKEARTRQKSFADKHRRSIEFQPGDRVFLKVSPAQGVRCFGIKGKLSPRFIGPFEILDRVGEVSYRLANVFHVSLLRGYKYHPLHVISFFGGTIPSGKPLGKPRSLSRLLILISFHNLLQDSCLLWGLVERVVGGVVEVVEWTGVEESGGKAVGGKKRLEVNSDTNIRPIFEKKFNSNMAFLEKIREQIEEEDNKVLKRTSESQAEKEANKQKLDEEVEELKRHLKIVPNDEDDVYTKATPLARKVPVVDYAIHTENNKPYF
nr:putative reverse transcriptase domain-containing protein [Tanacetum cinerariifolium]